MRVTYKLRHSTRLHHEFDETGNHRLVLEGPGVTGGRKEGEWAGYQSPAVLGKYEGLTEYWGMGETVRRVEELKVEEA